MSEPAGHALVRRGRDAAARGDWAAAFEDLVAADERGTLGLDDLPVLADAAYGAGRLDVTIETWERAYAGFGQLGDRPGAATAAVRIAMHLLFDTALMAPVRGWLRRAEPLLDDAVEAPAHAWFAVVRNYERMLAGDVEGARRWAARAIDVGSRCDGAAAAVGRVAEARCLILDGDVDRGVALLDEAGVAAVSGDLDPLATGVVYCELVCALQGLALYDLAEQWTEAMERWSRTNAIGSVRGRCRVHRAEILRLRGACDEAEVEAVSAWNELRPYLRRELGWPLTELGRIRLHRGDLAGAEEALVAAHRVGWDPQPDLALVLLARGDAVGAAAAIRTALDRPLQVPSKELPPNTSLRRAPLLAAQVEVEIAAGDVERARSAADELGAIAARFRSAALAAGATSARAQVCLADGDATTAEHLFDGAARQWNDVGAPYEAAMARRGLARALRARGEHRGADLEDDAAHAVLARLASDVHGILGAVTEPSPAETTPSVFRRVGDHWSIDFDGRTCTVRDLKGMRYLARLLADPGRERHVLDLVAVERGDASVDLGDAGAMLDAAAKRAYRRRLAEIDDDLAEARAAGDSVREAQADAEREFLVQELSRAVGLGGRDRRAGSASERARVAVTRAVRQAMSRVAEHHPPLGEHLEHAVRTGTYCSYAPDPRSRPAWDTGVGSP